MLEEQILTDSNIFLMLHNINLKKCPNCSQSDDASCHEVSDCDMANPFNVVNTQSCDYFEWKKKNLNPVAITYKICFNFALATFLDYVHERANIIVLLLPVFGML